MTLFEFDETDSTNNQARILINDGIEPPFWIIAHSQTMGRGRLERKWQSPKGNLYCSGVVSFGDKIPNPLYSFIIALAVLETLKKFAPQIPAKLKWPNDILVDGAKICGILLETHCFEKRNYLIIGVGVNLKNAPAIEGRATTSLYEFSHTVPSPREFVEVLDKSFQFFQSEFARNGFVGIRALWLESAVGIGTEVRIDQGGLKVKGIFKTMNDSGEIVLQSQEGEILINSGDVILQE